MYNRPNFTLLTVALLYLLNPLKAQQILNCGQNDLHENLLQKDALYKRQHLQMEEQLLQQIYRPRRKSRKMGITLPVVFHIIHNNGTENISDERIQIELENLNAAFANAGYYDPSLGVEIGIDFCLAARDPQGNATNGINRVASHLTTLNYSQEDRDLKALSIFEPTEYVNIWIVEEICNDNGCGVAGYAYLPGAHGRPIDGIVVEARFIGISEARSTVMVHEMGHYLGLFHTFNGGCLNNDCRTNGDRICDTPPDNTTAAAPCNVAPNSCTTDEDDTSLNNPFRPITLGGLGDQPDLHRNYMDYSRQECYRLFTQGQKDRMLSVLEGVRSSLLNSPACLPPCPNPVVANFNLPQESILAGTSLLLNNLSLNADRYEWRINDSLVSTQTNLNYNFTSVGDNKISLTAFSNNSNCLPQTIDQFITVACDISLDILSSTTQLPIDSLIVLSANAQNTNSFTWTLNDSIIGTKASLNFSASDPGFYRICLEGTNNNCTQKSCIILNIQDPDQITSCGNSFSITFNDQIIGNAIAASDGNFYLIGRTSSDARNSNRSPGLIMKITPEGSILWQRNFWAEGLGTLTVNHLIEDGEDIVFTMNQPIAGSQVVKYAPDTDEIVWSTWLADRGLTVKRIFNPPGSENYILVGNAINNGNHLAYLTMNQENGNLLEAIYYETGASNSCEDAILVDSNLYTVGSFQEVNNPEAVRQAGIAKLSLNGELIWANSYLLDTFTNKNISANVIAADGDDLVIVGSEITSSNLTKTELSFILKINENGSQMFTKLFEDNFSGTLYHQDIQVANNRYLIAKSFISSINPVTSIIEMDRNANLVSSKYLLSFATFFPTSISTLPLGKGVFKENLYIWPNINKIKKYNLNDFNCFSLWDSDANLLSLDNNSPLTFSPSIRRPSIPIESRIFQSERTRYLPTNDCECNNFEICGNGIDDDRNALIDCEDPGCDCIEVTDCFDSFLATASASLVSSLASKDGNLIISANKENKSMLSKLGNNGKTLWSYFLGFSGSGNINSLNEDQAGNIYGIAENRLVFKFSPTDREIIWIREFDTGFRSLDHMALDTINNRLMVQAELLDLQTTDRVESFTILNTEDGSIITQKFYDGLFSTSLFLSELISTNGRFYTNYGNFSDFLSGSGGIIEINLEDTEGSLTGKFYKISPDFSNVIINDFIATESGFLAVYSKLNHNANDGILLWVSKLDQEGNLVWTKKYNDPNFILLSQNWALSVSIDGFLISNIGFSFGNGSRNALIKINKEGEVVWSRAYIPGPSTDFEFSVGELFEQTSNGIFISGSAYSNGVLAQQSALLMLNNEGNMDNSLCSITEDLSVIALEETIVEQDNLSISERTYELLSEPIPPTLVENAIFSLDFLCAPQPCCSIDLAISSENASCNGDSLLLRFEISNEAIEDFNGSVPISFYDRNPNIDTFGQLFFSKTIFDVALVPGASEMVEINIPYPNGENLYLLLNDPGQNILPINLQDSIPQAIFVECDYVNNLDSLSFERPTLSIDLGPDTVICENSAFNLDAGSGFNSYRWPDASLEQTYTAFEAGVYWVEARTICNDIVTDTIEIILDAALDIDIDPSVAYICPDESATLSVNAFKDYTYRWYNEADEVICEECLSTEVTATENSTFYVVGSNPSGCFSADSIFVNVISCDNVLDITVCAGDSAVVSDKVFFPGDVDTLRKNLDTILLVKVNALPEAIGQIDTFLCPGQTITFEGETLMPGDTQIFRFNTENGCDSTLTLAVFQFDTTNTAEALTFCTGRNVSVFGELINVAGIYSQTFIDQNGCDSVHTISVTEQAPVVITAQPSSIDCETGTGNINLSIDQPISNLDFIWSNNSTARNLRNVVPGTYSVTVSTSAACISTLSTTLVDDRPEINALLNPIDVSCTNLEDGQLIIQNIAGGLTPYTFSLDNQNFQPSSSFDSLAPGNYTLTIKDLLNCTSQLDFSIQEPDPIQIILPIDTTVKLGDTVRLNPQVISNEAVSYQWEETGDLSCLDCPDPFAIAVDDTTYTLTVITDLACEASASINIFVDRTRQIYIPNVFSPNGDGVNDYFGLFDNNNVLKIDKVRIFSRWGGLVYEASFIQKDQIEQIWDGRLSGSGELAPQGNYVYYLAVDFLDNIVEIYSGEIILLR